jgi:hypothetical protein
MINNLVSYFNPDGTPTIEGIKLGKEIDQLKRQMAAIAAVTGPTGGSTTDAEARTAINAIISGAS